MSDGYDNFDIGLSPGYEAFSLIARDGYELSLVPEFYVRDLVSRDGYSILLEVPETSRSYLNRFNFDNNINFTFTSKSYRNANEFDIPISLLSTTKSAGSRNYFSIDSKINDVYVMRAVDSACGTLTYRYWKSYGGPDFTALYYNGPKCGNKSDLIEIVIYNHYLVTE